MYLASHHRVSGQYDSAIRGGGLQDVESSPVLGGHLVVLYEFTTCNTRQEGDGVKKQLCLDKRSLRKCSSCQVRDDPSSSVAPGC
jgi:hypothetical protein